MNTRRLIVLLVVYISGCAFCFFVGKALAAEVGGVYKAGHGVVACLDEGYLHKWIRAASSDRKYVQGCWQVKPGSLLQVTQWGITISRGALLFGSNGRTPVYLYTNHIRRNSTLQAD